MEITFNQRWQGCVVELQLKNRKLVRGTVTVVGKAGLTLRDVLFGDAQLPQARFEKHDIASVNVVTPSEMSSSDISSLSSSSPERFRAEDLPRYVNLNERAVKQKEVPAHLKGVDNRVDVDILTNRVPLPVQPVVNGHTFNVEQAPIDKFNADFIFIDTTDDTLTRAIELIKARNEIAVSLIGQNVSCRQGTPILLNIFDGDYVFIFDLLALGRAAFTTGEGVTLKDILESEEVTKVAHNCQGMSDVLSNLYKVELANVDDTLAFAASEFYMREGAYSKFVIGLPHALMTFLNLPSSHIFYPRKRQGMDDESIWRQRPLPDHLLLNACKTVVHLINLRDALVALHLTRAKKGSRILVNHMRSKEDDEAAMSYLDVENLMPLEFLRIDDIKCKPKSARQFKESLDGGSNDPYVHFTRDTQKLSRQTRSATTLQDYSRGYR